MKWWAKYFWLKFKYEELEKKYNELVDLVDRSWWDELDHAEDIRSRA